MMFILRTAGEAPSTRPLSIKARRRTPETVPNAAGKIDYFCVGEAEDIAALRAAGSEIIELRDGWYAGDTSGGIAIFGQGKYWEVRDTPFSVREAAGPASRGDDASADSELVNVRRAIFGV